MRAKVINFLGFFLVVAALLASQARGYNYDAYLKAAKPIAEAAWQSKCVDPPEILKGDLPSGILGRSNWSYLNDPLGPYFDCAVTINRNVIFTFPEFCSMLVHEYGHLSGLGHSEDPQNIMYPVLNVTWPACRTHPMQSVTHRRHRGRKAHA